MNAGFAPHPPLLPPRSGGNDVPRGTERFAVCGQDLSNERHGRRWFLPVSRDLREGGTFHLEGNASGEIVRCDPPRLLKLTWVYGDRPVDEVELRLSASDDGTATMLEIEHATVTMQAEWDGQLLDVIPGLGVGWELPLTVGLPRYLRGELPDAPVAEWFQPKPEDMQLAERAGQTWAALLQAAG